MAIFTFTALVDGNVLAAADINTPLSNAANATVPVANGGTGLTSGTSGAIPYFSAATTMASSSALTQYGIVYGGGAGSAPTAMSALTTGQLLVGTSTAPAAISAGTTGQVLIATTSAAPAFGTAPVRGMIQGLTLSNNGSDATNDIDIAEGLACDSTHVMAMALGSAITKRLDAAWAVGTNQGGLDTGSIANTTYHVWLIKRSDTGVVDALFSTSASAPTMPTSYDYKRRIGSIVRSGGAILAFVQNGILFQWVTPVLDVNSLAPASTSAVTRTLTVPTGIKVEAGVELMVFGVSITNAGVLSDLDTTDTAAYVADHAQAISPNISGTQTFGAAPVNVVTNTSAQIRSRLSSANATAQISIRTIGWRDYQLRP